MSPIEKMGSKMGPFTRLQRLLVLSLVLLGAWLIFLSTSSHQSATFPFAKSVIPSAVSESTEWSFFAARDRNNHSLNADQCTAAFPELYKEIDRAAANWREHNGNRKISDEQISLDWSSDGGLRCMIYDQQIYIIHSRGLNHFQHWKERSRATLLQIHRAVLASPEPVPNVEFSLKINDVVGITDESSNIPLWVFSRNISDPAMNQAWIMPDFNFWSYPRVTGSFSDFQQDAMEIGDDFDAKEPKLVWRGTTQFNPSVREPLLQQSAGKSWSNVHRVDEDTADENAAKHRISLPDHCLYKYAVHTEGTTWSGRLKYLLSCHSVVLIHSLTWTTHLYHLLEASGPNQNYQWVQDGWANLHEVMDNLIANPDQARLIADNAASKFRDRYLTPAAQTCYWRRLIQTWSEVAVEPDPWESVEVKDGRDRRSIRGLTLEEYLFWDGDYID